MHIKSNEIKGKKTSPPYERVIKILASPETQNMTTERFTFGMSIIPPHTSTEKHFHKGTEECIYVITGRGETEVAGTRFEIEPESVIMVKPGQDHQFINNSDETMKIVWVYSPPGAEKTLVK